MTHDCIFPLLTLLHLGWICDFFPWSKIVHGVQNNNSLNVSLFGRSILDLHLCQTWQFQFQCHKFFRSWVAILHLQPPMVPLPRSLYNMPRLAPPMDVLFWGQRDFQIGFLNRDTSRSAWNGHSERFVADTVILSNNMKLPSYEC